ncbi:MAG TPA: CmcJ/NvfI family oxidoreductase [Mycobacteriales bacterium]|nr:CmcJ/NvfI family oxidoreductase [Mycobacteriales bacterium]
MSHDSAVQAEINYVRNQADPTIGALEFVTEDESLSTMQTLPGRLVTVRTARDLPTSLDEEGFILVPHASKVADFRMIEEDPDTDALYIAEMTELLREVTGATFALMLGGGKKRFGEQATSELADLANAKPARYPHADNTDSSAADLHALVMSFLGDQVPNGSRWAMFNMWRAVSPPPQDIPLAVCDATTVAPGDEVTVTAITTTRESGDLRHDTTGYRYNAAHRWYYYPDMHADEVIVFKAHDTDPSRSRRVPHSAFTNSTCPAGTPTRSSIEARGLAVFA